VVRNPEIEEKGPPVGRDGRGKISSAPTDGNCPFWNRFNVLQKKEKAQPWAGKEAQE